MDVRKLRGMLKSSSTVRAADQETGTHTDSYTSEAHIKSTFHCRQRLQTQTTTAWTSTAPDPHLTAKESASTNQQSMKWNQQQHLMLTHILTVHKFWHICAVIKTRSTFKKKTVALNQDIVCEICSLIIQPCAETGGLTQMGGTVSRSY